MTVTVSSPPLHLLFYVLIAFVSPATPPRGCTDELVSMSACLGYISAPPNNFADIAGIDCCNALSKVVESGNTNCLCYLIIDKLFFGFPLNLSRVASLPSSCSTNSTLAIDPLCSGIPANKSLPPLNGITGAVQSNPINFVPLVFNPPPPPPPQLPTLRRPIPTLNLPPQLDRPPQIADQTPSTSTLSEAQTESTIQENSNSSNLLHFSLIGIIIWMLTIHLIHITGC